MNVFRRDNHYVFALTYGHDVHMVKNVLAIGEAAIRMGNRVVLLINSEPITEPNRDQCRLLLGLTASRHDPPRGHTPAVELIPSRFGISETRSDAYR